jgi:hypothetical protein
MSSSPSARRNVDLTRRGDDLEKSLAKANLNMAMYNFERGRAACEQGELGTGLLRRVESWRPAVAAGRPGDRLAAHRPDQPPCLATLPPRTQDGLLP